MGTFHKAKNAIFQKGWSTILVKKFKFFLYLFFAKISLNIEFFDVQK